MIKTFLKVTVTEVKVNDQILVSHETHRFTHTKFMPDDSESAIVEKSEELRRLLTGELVVLEDAPTSGEGATE